MHKLYSVLDEVSTYEVTKSGIITALFNYLMKCNDCEGMNTALYLSLYISFFLLGSTQKKSFVVYFNIFWYVQRS
jgi:hypothetical protein